MLSTVASELGFECIGVEYSPGRGSALVRVYIDVPDRAVTIDDCEKASRQFSAMLDAEDPIAGHYTLEVSSPGIDRPLFALDHFKRYVGHVVKLETALPIAGRRRFQGPIREVHGSSIRLEQDGKLIDIGHENVQKARLVPDFGIICNKVSKNKKRK